LKKLLLKHKVRSGALQFTLFISVVIALILAGALLLAYTHGVFIQQSKATINNIQLADSGITTLLKQTTLSADTIALNLPNNTEGQTLKTHLSQWGVFEKAYVVTTHRNKKFIKCSLLGSSFKSSQRAAVYLQENYNPLAVVGNTRIEGIAYLPEQGLRPGNISGNSYYGTELVYGSVKKSTIKLPELTYDYKQNLRYYLEEYKPQNSESYIALKDKVANSFNDAVKGYYSAEPIILNDVSLSGNLIIRSSSKITIKKTALLKDIIIAAPLVEVEDGVTGNFQIIASTTIKIGKKCVLSYPSALIIIKKESAETPSEDLFYNKIVIDEKSTIRGSVCYFSDFIEKNYKVNIFVSLGSSIKGEIYCEGNLELKGNVAGSVYTQQFITNEGGTVFLNHLYNAQIVSKNLPEAFGGILFKNESKSIMKWLY